jgi:hypothetical protein
MVSASLMKLSQQRSRSLARLKIQQVLFEMEEKDMQSATIAPHPGNVDQHQVEFRTDLYSGPTFVPDHRSQSPYSAGGPDEGNAQYL